MDKVHPYCQETIPRQNGTTGELYITDVCHTTVENTWNHCKFSIYPDYNNKSIRTVEQSCVSTNQSSFHSGGGAYCCRVWFHCNVYLDFTHLLSYRTMAERFRFDRKRDLHQIGTPPKVCDPVNRGGSKVGPAHCSTGYKSVLRGLGVDNQYRVSWSALVQSENFSRSVTRHPS